MRIIEVTADVSTPEGRERAMQEIMEEVQGLPLEQQKTALDAAVKALDAFAKGTSPMDVNLIQVADRLGRLSKHVERIREKLDDSAPESGERAYWHGNWSGMLIIASGALHSVAHSMKLQLAERDTEPPPAETAES